MAWSNDFKRQWCQKWMTMLQVSYYKPMPLHAKTLQFKASPIQKRLYIVIQKRYLYPCICMDQVALRITNEVLAKNAPRHTVKLIFLYSPR